MKRIKENQKKIRAYHKEKTEKKLQYSQGQEIKVENHFTQPTILIGEKK